MICLSFDTDHTDEARMREFIDAFPIPGEATFFCTQRYESIPERHEVGAHVVLEWGSDWEAALSAARDEFPQARGFRSHGCLWSHGLTLALAQRGYSYISAHDQFGRPDPVPHREAWGIWHLPIYYMDTLDLAFPHHWPRSGHPAFSREVLERAVRGDGLYVFAFHPIHMLLNSTSTEAYLSLRDRFLAGSPLDEIACDGHGVASYYRDLLELMRESRVESVRLAEALEGFSKRSTALA